MIDLAPILNAVIALAAALVTAFLLPWLKQKVSAGKREDIVFWLSVAVKAAEEYFSGPGRGEEKAAYVRQFLAGKGFELDLAEVTALINSAVWELLHGVKEGG